MAIDMAQSGEISGSLSSRLKVKKGGRESDQQDEPKDYMKNWKKRQADGKASLPYSKRQRFEIPRENENAPVIGSFGLGISGYANEAKKAANNIGAKSSKHITFDDYTSTPVSKPDSSRRKSVTFTPDTKVEDGFSASKIGKLYLPPRNAEKSPRQTVEETVPEQVQPASPSKPQIPEKKKRKQKKNSKQQQQPRTLSTASTTPGPLAKGSTPSQSRNKENPPYLQYLQQYRDDRSNWKFNSTKQKLLLKNALNIFRIPLSYNSALLEYIAGLQSKSFRTELAKQADEGLLAFYTAHRGPDAPDLPSMDALAARRSAYQTCVERAQEEYKQRGGLNGEAEDKALAQVRFAYEGAERLEAILYDALMVELHPEQLVSTTKPATNTSNVGSQPSNDESTSIPTKRKRKARTEVSSDEDSSSSSSSDSSSEDESESEDDSDPPALSKHKSKKPKPIITAELLDKVFGKKDSVVNSAVKESDSDESASDGGEGTESSDGSDTESDDE